MNGRPSPDGPRDAGQDRPFPPGDYPAIVVGSGPGGLQVSYALRALGIEHAVLSRDDRPGGMFRQWPFFQRLLSWTKPHAPAARGSRAYERYDWNSLLADEPELRALQPEFMDGTSYFPSRPEMEANLAAFAERAAIRVRYGTTWTGTHLVADERGRAFELDTTDGTYRCRALVLAVGVAEPYTPTLPGIDLAHHYAGVRPAESYAGRRVFIIGKQNSGFELANGLLPWARQLILSSPSSARLSVDTRSLVGVRARYVQPYEDHVLGGGVSILDAAIRSIDAGPDGTRTVTVDRTDGGGSLSVDVDEVIAATGFVAPLLDLPNLGCRVFGASRLPVQTAWWESATLPGVYFAGTIGQGARGLMKHGIPANSGAVHGARYNARVLARRIAEKEFGRAPEEPAIEPGRLVDFLTTELAEAPELWHQRAYLGRVVTVDRDGRCLDGGVQPLAHALDDDGGTALILTLEADGSGDIYPVVYVRRPSGVTERRLDHDPLLRYDTPAARAALADIARSIGVAP